MCRPGEEGTRPIYKERLPPDALPVPQDVRLLDLRRPAAGLCPLSMSDRQRKREGRIYPGGIFILPGGPAGRPENIYVGMGSTSPDAANITELGHHKQAGKS
jgi:hypothetical protein